MNLIDASRIFPEEQLNNQLGIRWKGLEETTDNELAKLGHFLEAE